MKEIDLLQYLIQDAKEELERMEEYEKFCADRDNKVWWETRFPSKQRIYDNLKMIRRISLDIERKL